MNSYNQAELTQALFEESGDALFLFDPETENLCEVNPTAERLTGFRRRELLQTQVTYLFRSEAQGGLERLRQAFRRTGLFHSQEGFLLRRMDGRWVPVNLTIARLHLKPNPLGLITARDVGEHREAHARLKQAEERLRTVVSNAPVVLFSLDAKGVFTLFEGQGLQALGLRPGEVVGRSIFEVYREAPRILENIRRVLAGEDFTASVEVEGGPGAGCWFQIHYAPLRDRHGQVSGAIGVAADITESRRAAAALRRSRQDHEALVDSIDGIVWEADARTFRFTIVSHYAERLLGYPVERWITEPTFWKDHVHPEDRDSVVELCIAATAAGKSHTLEYRFLAADGSVVWLRDLVTVAVQDGQPTRLRGVMVDITERKRLEEAIRQAEAKYRGIFEHTAEGIYQTSTNGRFLTGNPALVRIFGFSSTQDMLTSDRDFYGVPGRRAEFLKRIAREGHVTDFESEIVCPDGRRTWISENARVLRDADGVATGYEGTVTDISARKRAEEALRQSEGFFRALIEKSSEAVTLISAEGAILYDSPSVTRITGRSPEESLGHSALEFIHPDDVPRMQGLLAACLADPEHEIRGEFRCWRQDGVWRDMEGAVVSRLADPCVRAIVINYRDITERKHAEEALRRSEARFRELFDNANDIVYTTDLDGQFTSWNRAGERIIGYTPEEALTLHISAVVAPEHLQRARQMIERKLAGEDPTTYELEVVTKDGRRVPLEVSTRLLWEGGKPIGVQGISRDVTERKRVEAVLRASEARYRSLIENLEQNILLKDRHFRWVAVNRAYCQGLGRSEAELLGKDDFEMYPRYLAEKYRADDLVVLTEGRRLEMEEENLADGKLRTVRTVKTPIRDDEGRVTGILIIFWDVTEQRTLEEQLRQAQKMEAIGQLAGGVAHDFNNLLTVILGNVSLQMAGLPPDVPSRELLAAAEQAALRGAELTRQLLGFSRKTTLRPQPTDLNRIASEAVTLLRRTIDPRIRIEIKTVPDLWAAHADPSQMNQVLMNLCLNARDAMPGGGRLLLETENLALDEEYMRLYLGTRAGEFVRLRVSDTGHGMPPEVRARIFEPFFTTKGVGKGTGLGLAMVYGIVNQHDGWIDCYSEVGKGTCFEIYLPRSSQDTGATALTSQTPVPCSGTETILLVDDEPMIRSLGRAILQKYGYQVLLAEDGVEAVEVYRREMGRIALVILDRTMPRLSGSDALVQLRQIDPEVRVVFSSGYSADQTGSEAGDVQGYVNKPYQPQELGNTVRSILDRTRHAPISGGFAKNGAPGAQKTSPEVGLATPP